ncbi:MAG TPA: ECF transporter S component, partial [Candidatus Enterococcus avicola]|nr:ECF transporter S component [Candidatus Enterococcus avicola]
VLDVLIYAEPANKVFTQGFAAGIANIVTVAVIGTILLSAYAQTRNKSDSLSKE